MVSMCNENIYININKVRLFQHGIIYKIQGKKISIDSFHFATNGYL